jgi:uncharacterized membrane protein
MALLPTGLEVPPLPYLLVLALGAGAVGYALQSDRPAVTDRLVLALTPWMVVGAAAHVLYVVDAVPTLLRPFAGAPTVYLTVAIVVGGVGWAAARTADPPQTVLVVGLVALGPLVAAAIAVGLARGRFSPLLPLAGVGVSLVLAAGLWVALLRAFPRVSTTGRVGILALVGHALDGVSTALGVDLLGFGERTPLSRVIMEFAATLPTADVLGVGWLFVLVKLVVASGVVVLLTDYVRDEPEEGYLLLGLVSAVGLGPGAHNVILFAVSTP